LLLTSFALYELAAKAIENQRLLLRIYKVKANPYKEIEYYYK